MPKRPGRERGKEYDRWGSPVEAGIEDYIADLVAAAQEVPDVDGEEPSDEEASE